MKNKGFTLVELLAVIIVVAAISLLVMFAMEKLIFKTKDKAYAIQIKNITDGAKNYILTCENPLECVEEDEDGNCIGEEIAECPKFNMETVAVPFGTLVKYGFVKKGLVNPKTNKSFEDANVNAEITKRNNKYIIKIKVNDSIENSVSAEGPGISIDGKLHETLAINSSVPEYFGNCNVSSSATCKITININGAEKIYNKNLISTSTPTKYQIKYEASHSIDTEKSIMYRNITVKL